MTLEQHKNNTISNTIHKPINQVADCEILGSDRYLNDFGDLNDCGSFPPTKVN